MTQVVLASHNAHKLEELRRILTPLVPGIELLGYEGPEPIESGTTFEANALIKARAAAAHTGLPAIADDSGIAVDVLGGSPGIFSARWGGPARSDAANLELLLWQMSDLADEHRAASFLCAAALALPAGVTRADGSGPAVMLREVAASHPEQQLSNSAATSDGALNEVVLLGEWKGSLLREPHGEGGFGYDPIFCPEGGIVSAAELTPAEKDAQSHRRRAFTALAPEIRARLSL